MFTHNCTKCRAVYSDTDSEPYLCPPCVAERKAVAARVDAEFAVKPRAEVKSALQEFDDIARSSGGVLEREGRKITFIKA